MEAYVDNGLIHYSVDPGGIPAPGETWFSDVATPEELAAVFPGYTAAMQARAMESLKATYTRAAQMFMDGVVGLKGYDGILSLCSYATSTNPSFRAQAQAGVVWRDAVWTEGYSILAQIQAGTMAPPASTEAFLNMLPLIAWPTEP